MEYEGSAGTSEVRPFRNAASPRVLSASAWIFLNFLLLLVLGLASGRLLYEWLFPRWLWLARPLPAAALALVVAIAISLFLRHKLDQPLLFLVLMPLLLNLVYLFDPTVDLVRGRFLFFAALWLSAALGKAQGSGGAEEQRSRRTVGSWQLAVGGQRSAVSSLQSLVSSLPNGTLFILLALLPVYLLTMSHAVGQADTFEFQVVAPQLGIAHPTGYPLYLLLGKLFSWLPLSTVAWRLNLASAVYALITTILLYQLICRLLGERSSPALPALLAAVALGLSPTFWSQAIVAEVYTLHALLVALALTLMVALVRSNGEPARQERLAISLAFVCGLALTNHLTSLFLLPGAAVAILVGFGRRPQARRPTTDDRRPIMSNQRSAVLGRPSFVIRLGLAFAAPLLLYAYLPLRWQAVNHEAMGFARLVDWVIGGRFQGALQWNAWLQDPTRVQVIGRLFLQNWGWPYLLLALIGFLFLVRHHRTIALILFLTWSGFTFYALNYYVPDLAVFLIPSHLIVAVCLAAGIAAPLRWRDWRLETRDSNLPISQSPSSPLTIDHSPFTIFLLFWLIVCALPAVWLAANHWAEISQADKDGLLSWGAGVLAMPLDIGAAILADSEKIAPLYYLQQAEGVRPDLEIMVLPDEAAYRAELDSRTAAGQTVYLARFLPGLAGVYSLRSVGPLVEASNRPLETLPPDVTPADLQLGPLELLGYALEPKAAVDANSAAVTLYWRRAEDDSAGSPPVVYIRWSGPNFTGDLLVPEGQHPVNNHYPVNAWKSGEIVSDYYLLPHPLAGCTGEATGGEDRSLPVTSRPVASPLPADCRLSIEVAVGPIFTSSDALDWHTVTAVSLPPATGLIDGRAYRTQFPSFLLHTASFPTQVRPGRRLEVQYSGFGAGEVLEFELRPVESGGTAVSTPEEQGSRGATPRSLAGRGVRGEGSYAQSLDTALPNGRYHLVARSGDGAAVCGWLQPVTAGCVLGEIEISGVPLPPGATNFDDQMALLDVNLQQESLQPGGQLALELTWQSLAPMTENYTVFVQVVNEQDQIVGQVDAWPVQGTYPTSQWRVGEVVRDPYVVQLQGDLTSGRYRLHTGWYLMSTLRRLPVLDDHGTAVDDKFVVDGLHVP